MPRFNLICVNALILGSATSCADAFAPSHVPTTVARKIQSSAAFYRPERHAYLLSSASSGDVEIVDEEEEQPTPSKVDNILKDIHSHGLPFRVVVIGTGAILETTSVLGPHFATSTSPKTGERLVTLASEDKSFEFHLKVDQISKVTFTEKDKATESGEKKTLRICRFINDMGNPICSLILADSSKEAAEWFTNMTIRYGYDVQL